MVSLRLPSDEIFVALTVNKLFCGIVKLFDDLRSDLKSSSSVRHEPTQQSLLSPNYLRHFPCLFLLHLSVSSSSFFSFTLFSLLLPLFSLSLVSLSLVSRLSRLSRL